MVAAIESRLEAVENRSGIQIDFAVDGECNLPLHIENGLYRITLEALTNVLKHAQATHIEIRLQFSQTSTILEIQDDGVGFDPAIIHRNSGMGIPGMMERAKEIGAEFHIKSDPGEGTLLTTKVDINNA